MKIDSDLKDIVSTGISFFKDPELKLYPYVCEQLLRFLNKPDFANAEATFKRLLNFYKKFYLTEDFIKRLNNYEKNIGSLLPSYRIHYIHAIYVFIIGLCIYISNSKVRKVFSKEGHFLYLWTISSLLHDIGYFVELTSLIINETFAKLFQLLNQKIVNPIELSINKNDLNLLVKLDEESNKNILEEYIKLLVPTLKNNHSIKMFARELKLNFCKDLNNGYANHGTIGSIVVTKAFWASYKNKGTKGVLLFNDYIVKSSLAIFFHTNHKSILNILKLRNISFEKYPLMYLLFLCDELQEWNRYNPKTTDHLNYVKMLKNETNKYRIIYNNGKLKYLLPHDKAEKIRKKILILKNWKKYITLNN